MNEFSYSLVEKIFFYIPQAVFIIPGAVFIVSALRGRALRLVRFLGFFTAVYLAGFTYLFMVSGYAEINGAGIHRGVVLITAMLGCVLIKNSVPRGKNSAAAEMFFAGGAVVALYYENPLVVVMALGASGLSEFFLMAGGAEKEDEGWNEAAVKKAGYLAAAIVFAGLFAAGGQIHALKLSKTAFTALVMFLIMASGPVLVTTGKPAAGTRPQARAARFIFMASGASVLLCAVYRLVFANPGILSPVPLIIVVSFLLCLSLLRTVTEEKYYLFAESDIINIFYLGLLAVFSSDFRPEIFFLIPAVMLLIGFINSDFLAAGENSRLTIAKLKYNIHRIQGGAAALAAVFLAVALEIFIFTLIFRGIKGTGLIEITMYLILIIYSINMLNKFFIMLSMAKRVTPGTGAGKTGRGGILFAVFAALLVAAGGLI